MEVPGVSGCYQFDGELRALLEGLMGDVCALAARWSSALLGEISACRTENQQLSLRLSLLEQKVCLGDREGNLDTPDRPPEPGSGTEVRVCTVKSMNMERTESTGPSGDQRQRTPALSGMKEEEIEISVPGRVEHRLDACSDAVPTPHYTDPEVNTQLPDLKTEGESNTEAAIPKPDGERSGDDRADGEDDSQYCVIVGEECKDQITQLGPFFPSTTEGDLDGGKNEEQEHLLTPYLNCTPWLTNPEPVSSDCSVVVALEGNADMSATDLRSQHSNLTRRASGPSQGEKQKGPRYICNICGKSLSSKYSLTAHLRVHTGDRPYACTQCGKRFVNKSALQIHQNIHTGAKPYVCMLCPKSFADPSTFNRHKRMHSRKLQQRHRSTKGQFICNICGKKLSTKQGLTYHMTLHTGDGPHICAWCGKSFVRKHNLKIHQRIHNGTKPYASSLCPKSFSKELQQRHHSPKGQFICYICGKKLSTKQGLTYHITLHTGDRPHICAWCGKSFVRKHNLKIHQHIHTGAKPFACTHCPKSFADPSTLKTHQRIHV